MSGCTAYAPSVLEIGLSGVNRADRNGGGTNPRVGTGLAPEPFSGTAARAHHCVDRVGRSLVGLPEKMAVDRQRDGGRAVPDSAADRHGIEPGGNQSRDVRMPQRVKHHPRQPASPRRPDPVAAEIVRPIGLAVPFGKNEIVRTESAQPQLQAQLKLRLPMHPQNFDHVSRDAERTATMS
jgi:hypothetical protein